MNKAVMLRVKRGIASDEDLAQALLAGYLPPVEEEPAPAPVVETTKKKTTKKKTTKKKTRG